MSFVEPKYTRKQVTHAGKILVAPADYLSSEVSWAADVLANWRASHGYPLNTFQATLRAKLRDGYGPSIVAQRLKRAPSIVSKLIRFKEMQLARMQDIGGLRAVLATVGEVHGLAADYRGSNFAHTLVNSKDYIASPKEDGYRGIHLIYRYQNHRAPGYDGLCLELQIRTNRQHAWATAVETMGTFLGQALKAGQGDRPWREFFSIASAALASVEETAAVPCFENLDRSQLVDRLEASERELNVLSRLQGFAIAADRISTQKGSGAYHLIVLNSQERTVRIRPYAAGNLEAANVAYAEVEDRARDGESVEAVLVAAGPVAALRQAYPNYFLDTAGFASEMRTLMRRRRR